MWPTTNVGEVTGPSTPSARSAPRTNVVFPAPSSPEISTTSPGARVAASRAPARSVSSGAAVSSVGAGNSNAEREAGAEQERAAERHRPRVDARVGQRRRWGGIRVLAARLPRGGRGRLGALRGCGRDRRRRPLLGRRGRGLLGFV